MSTGFSNSIYPRNPNEIVEYIKKKLSGTENPRMELLPWFRGHKGRVAYNKELGRNESFGVVVKNNMNSYTVTELPIGVEYQKYIETLDRMCDAGTIQDYDDRCDPKTDAILFEIKTTREFTKNHMDERSLYDAFRLVKSLPETLCCIDEDNRVREFSSVKEILDSFIKLRLGFYGKRREHLMTSIKDRLVKLASRYYFVKGIVDGSIVVNRKKKEDVVRQLEKIEKIRKVDGSYDFLLAMPIAQLTSEKLDELKKQIEDGKAEFKTVKDSTPEAMWINDLNVLKKMF